MLRFHNWTDLWASSGSARRSLHCRRCLFVTRAYLCFDYDCVGRRFYLGDSTLYEVAEIKYSTVNGFIALNNDAKSFQFRILSLRFVQDRHISISVLPQSEEFFISLPTLRSITLESRRLCEPKLCQGP